VFDWWHPFFGLCHGTISFLLRKYYQNKVLFITENVISHEGNLIDKLLTRIGLKFASKFLTLSRIVEKEVQDYAKGKKIFRTELPVYDCYKDSKQTDMTKAKSALGFKENSILLLFFGYVRKYKGLDLLIEAFPFVLKKFPDARLMIVGEFYDNPQEYLKLIDKNKIHDHVLLVNQFVPNEDVAKYYNACDVVILPYRSATQSGILNVAYGFNKPVVATDVGGLAEFIEDGRTGFIVKQITPEKLAGGIIKFIENRSSINFSENIQRLNTQNKFNSLPEVFKQIISES
jgi:glycosyltransferase involved in cell wall biosynthesis